MHAASRLILCARLYLIAQYVPYPYDLSDPAEIRSLVDTLEQTDAGTNLMHESFQADNAYSFTRPWYGLCSLVRDPANPHD